MPSSIRIQAKQAKRDRQQRIKEQKPVEDFEITYYVEQPDSLPMLMDIMLKRVLDKKENVV